MYVNEVGNDIAAKSVDIAINYVKKNTNLGVSISVTSVEGNRTDSKPFLEASMYDPNYRKKEKFKNILS